MTRDPKTLDENEEEFVIIGPVLASGESPITGRTYLEEDLKRMVDEFKDNEFGVFGEMVSPGENCDDYGPTVNMDRVSHKVERLWFEDGCIMTEMKVLGTPHGTILGQLLEGVASKEISGTFEPTPVMTGTVDNKVVVDPTLIRVDAIFRPEKSEPVED